MQSALNSIKDARINADAIAPAGSNDVILQGNGIFLVEKEKSVL